MSDLRIYCPTSEFSVRPQNLVCDLRVYCPTSEFYCPTWVFGSSNFSPTWSGGSVLSTWCHFILGLTVSLLLNLVHPPQPHQSWHDKPPFIEHLYMYGEILTHFSVNTQTAWYSSYSQIGSKSRRIPGSESCGIRISWAAIGTLSLSLFLLFLLVTLLILFISSSS